MDKQHVDHLAAQVNEVHTSMQRFVGEAPLVDLLKIIHKPGFTTIAEQALFLGIVDSMLAHTKVLEGLKHVLHDAASKVELNPQPLPPGKSHS